MWVPPMRSGVRRTNDGGMSTRVCDPFRSRPARAALIGVLLAMLLSIVGVPGAASVPSAAAAGVRWFDGGITYSNVVNCPSIIWGSPYTELGAGAYVGFSADPETSTPGVGQTYYVRVAVAALGSTCSGQLADLNVKLPPNTSLAIGAGSPIRCFVGTSELNGTRCPQALSSSAGSYGPGFLRIADVDTTYSGLWPLPAGGAQLSVQIPVVSSAVLAGATLEGRVRVLDGNDSPTLAPTQGVYVFSSQPTILHDTASTTFTSGTWPTTIRSAALLYPKGTSGNAWFDLLSGPGGSVVFSDGPAVVPAGQSNAYEVWSDWTPYPFQIQPNTTLTWRFRYVTSGGTTYTGPEQTFTTPPANTAIVGTGSAASCTSAALTNALASGQATITFQCGAQPAEIQLAGEVVVPAGRTIDGDDKITLRAAPNQRALRFTAGTNEVRDLTITGGNSSGCGGGVLVTGGFTAMREVRIVGNRAVTGGGACVQSPNGLGIYSSSVTGNAATQAGGGLYVSGGADVQTTDISGNTAGNDGGVRSHSASRC